MENAPSDDTTTSTGGPSTVAEVAAEALLAPLTPLPRDEAEELARHLMGVNGLELGPGFVEKVADTESGRSAAALAVELSTTGGVPEPSTLVLFALAIDSEGGELALDALRVLARLWRKWGHTVGDSPHWFADVLSCLIGVRRPERGPLRTKAQLDSVAAVVDFTLGANVVDPSSVVEHEQNGQPIYSLASPALESVLLERPHDINSIYTYVSEWGGIPRDSAEADLLRHWLDSSSESPAVGDRWLWPPAAMADPAHLAPDHITDRRGRATTVCRKPTGGAAPSAPATAVPSISLVLLNSPASVADSLPLKAKKRTRAEHEEFIASLDLTGDPAYMIGKYPDSAIGERILSLAAEYREQGLLDRGLLLEVLRGGACKEMLDTLRVTAVLSSRDEEIRKTVAGWPKKVVLAITGLYWKHERYRGTSTRGQLHSSASVIDFILRFEPKYDDWDPPTQYDVIDLSKRPWIMVANPALEDYLREGPYDPERISRIADYVNEHGIDADDPEVVHRMRGVLDGGAEAALGDGWL